MVSGTFVDSRAGVRRISQVAGTVRVDRYGNVCFPYFDFKGIAGIERRNHNIKCYTKGEKLTENCKKSTMGLTLGCNKNYPFIVTNRDYWFDIF